MFETMAAWVMTEHMAGLSFEPPIGGPGYNRLLTGGRKPVPTSDGFIAMLPYTGDHWAALFHSVGRDDLVEKYRVHDRHARNDHMVDLYREMVAITRQRDTAYWLKACEELDIPSTRIYSIGELPEHPHLKAVGLFRTGEHPSEGTLRYIASPTRFHGSPASVRSLAPRLGEHTAQVLRNVGYTDEEIARLADAKVVRLDAAR